MADLAGAPDFRRWLAKASAEPPRSGLDARARAALRRHAVRERHRAGTVLLAQGARTARVLLLEEGQVELVRTAGREQLVVQRLGPSAVVGDLPLLLGLPAPYSALARSEIVAWALGLDALAAALQAEPQLAFDWLRAVALRLERSYRRLLELSGKSALERVAQCLVDEAEDAGQPVVAVTQADLGRLLALSRQTVSGALRELQSHGLVVRRHGRVEIVDPERLRRVAHSSRALRPAG